MIDELVENIAKLQQKFQSERMKLEDNRIYSTSIQVDARKEVNLHRLSDVMNLYVFYMTDQEEEIIGIGDTYQIRSKSTDRYEELRKEIKKLQATFHQYEKVGFTPRIFGGFTFVNKRTEGMWKEYTPLDFFLPTLTLRKIEHKLEITLNLTKNTKIERVLDEIKRLKNIEKTVEYNEISKINYPLTKKKWEKTIQEAHQAMDKSKLEKVVLSRVSEIQTQHRIQISKVLSNLMQRYPECYNFTYKIPNGGAFYGASPELLVHIRENEVSTVALAGTRPRGHSIEEDQNLAEDLFNHPKEREEHQLVVEQIVEELNSIGKVTTVSEVPYIHKLHNVQHLKSDVQAIINGNTSAIDIIQLLHPTPALGGKPRNNAMKFIESKETSERGMYASPIGWIDLKLDAKFIVAIRSAISKDNITWLYAGAGIMRESDASDEWEEIELKFKPILDALEVKL